MADLVDTVDKMQGDEASTIIYSATASSPAAYRQAGEFYLTMNRANVAFSRAKVARGGQLSLS
jgi:superfamily I DNA and/or RNA helicase